MEMRKGGVGKEILWKRQERGEEEEGGGQAIPSYSTSCSAADFSKDRRSSFVSKRMSDEIYFSATSTSQRDLSSLHFPPSALKKRRK